MNTIKNLLTLKKLAILIIAAQAIITPATALSQTAAQVKSEPNPKVQFSTTAGNFVVELHPDKAPKTVANFLQYVKDKHYDGTIFHRVIDNFMVQGGGFDAAYVEKKTPRSG